MDDIKVEKWTLEDGRRAERRVTEQKNCEDGSAERVVELHVEDERPLRLQQRVVEKTKPFVYERQIQTVDKTGQVVEQKVESIEPRVQMQVVEHIAHAGAVAAQSVKEDDCDCHVTKQEMIETIVAAIKADRQAREVAAPVKAQSVVPPAASSFQSRLATGGLADELNNKLNPQNYSTMDKVLLGVIAAQIIGLGYVIFFM
jgi:hypothetical protein